MGTNTQMETDMVTPVAVSHRIRNVLLAGFTIIVAVISYLLSVLFLPPTSFPVKSYVDIPEGSTLYQVADILHEQGIISSPFVFREYFRFFKSDKFVSAGKYYFDTRLCLVSVADRLSAADFHIPRFKILIPEGSDVKEISKYIKDQIPPFDADRFVSLASNEEGYLFPDTYFFSIATKPEEVITKMKDDFQTKINPLNEKILASKKSLHDILTMASIIERETVTPESRRIVSGILWKRIKIGMPLQVDATFSYVNGKSTYDLTAQDLHIDSKYNTYEYKGLPPGPICNPGLDSIIASIEPTATDYLYYLSGKDGTMHYAKTFSEHISNKIKYLK